MRTIWYIQYKLFPNGITLWDWGMSVLLLFCLFPEHEKNTFSCQLFVVRQGTLPELFFHAPESGQIILCWYRFFRQIESWDKITMQSFFIIQKKHYLAGIQNGVFTNPTNRRPRSNFGDQNKGQRPRGGNYSNEDLHILRRQQHERRSVRSNYNSAYHEILDESIDPESLTDLARTSHRVRWVYLLWHYHEQVFSLLSVLKQTKHEARSHTTPAVLWKPS